MNPETLHYINLVLGLGAILLQIASIIVILLVVLKRGDIVLDFVKEKNLILGFLITVSAMLGSLFYSNVVGFLPCVLCWYQRIFMFPMVFLFGVALFKKDNNVFSYITPLAVVGLLFAIYQNFFYYFGGDSSNLPCDASGVSCYQRLISEFDGYVSFPIFSLTVFLAILALASVSYLYKKNV